MKKTLFISLLVFASILTFGSCKKSDSKKAKLSSANESVSVTNSSGKSGKNIKYSGVPFNPNSYSEDSPEYKERNSLHLGTNESNQVDFDSVSQFFALDYTPEYPDSYFSDNTQNTKTSKKKGKTSSDKNDKNESYVPGIRKLSDYMTKYVTKKAALQEYKPSDEAEVDDSSKDFYIEDWGPQEKIVAGENHPSFYVIFSRSAKSLEALDKPQTTSDIMTIEPELPGIFRWYGSKHLSFEADQPADPTVRYKISINPNMMLYQRFRIISVSLREVISVHICRIFGALHRNYRRRPTVL